MTREIGLGLLSGSCAITDISLGQLCLRVSLEPEVDGSRISVLESRRDAAPEEVVQLQHSAHQQHVGNLVATDCHSQVPGGALQEAYLPNQVWQHKPKRWPGWI